jgi:hypothetical protein
MTGRSPRQRVGEAEREPGENKYEYVTPNGHLWCPWCGEPLCYANGSRKQGPYTTEGGETVASPVEPSDTDGYSYHPDCYAAKQTEIREAENVSRWTFGDDEGGETR